MHFGWRNAGWKLHSGIITPSSHLQRLVMDLLMRGGDEAFEQRVRLVRLAQEFRMELAGQVGRHWRVKRVAVPAWVEGVTPAPLPPRPELRSKVHQYLPGLTR